MKSLYTVNLDSLLQNLYKNSTEAMFFFDREGKALALNPAAEQILNIDVLEKLKAGVDQAMCGTCKGYTSDQELQSCLNCYLNNSDAADFSSFQVYLDTKGKGVIPYAATFHTIDQEQGIRIFMLRDLSTQLETQKRLNQNMLMRHVLEAQEKERKRISRELHDGIAQELLSAVIDLRTMKYISSDVKVLAKVQETQSTLSRLLEEIRSLSVELRPSALDDLGLEAAFRSHFKRVEQTYGVFVDFEAKIGKARYHTAVETVCYRVCQEAVMNTIKYAGVDEVRVTLREEHRHVVLEVRDEGKGFNKKNQPKGTGLGLFGMKERAELIEGSLRIDSAPGKGTCIHLSIPLKGEE